MNTPDNLKYSKTHEWLSIQDNIATVGISDHAQSELGDIIFVETPEVGQTLEMGGELGTVEAVKTVATLYSPVSGEVLEINSKLEDEADIINTSAYEQGWIVKIKVSDISSDLLTATEYQTHIGEV